MRNILKGGEKVERGRSLGRPYEDPRWWTSALAIRIFADDPCAIHLPRVSRHLPDPVREQVPDFGQSFECSENFGPAWGLMRSVHQSPPLRHRRLKFRLRVARDELSAHFSFQIAPVDLNAPDLTREITQSRIRGIDCHRHHISNQGSRSQSARYRTELLSLAIEVSF